MDHEPFPLQTPKDYALFFCFLVLWGISLAIALPLLPVWWAKVIGVFGTLFGSATVVSVFEEVIAPALIGAVKNEINPALKPDDSLGFDLFYGAALTVVYPVLLIVVLL
jgi:hypothetical protein